MWRLLAGFEATIPVPPTLDDETPSDLLQRGEYKAVNALVKGDGSISDGCYCSNKPSGGVTNGSLAHG